MNNTFSQILFLVVLPFVRCPIMTNMFILNGHQYICPETDMRDNDVTKMFRADLEKHFLRITFSAPFDPRERVKRVLRRDHIYRSVKKAIDNPDHRHWGCAIIEHIKAVVEDMVNRGAMDIVLRMKPIDLTKELRQLKQDILLFYSIWQREYIMLEEVQYYPYDIW